MYVISTLSGEDAIARILDSTGDAADTNLRTRALRSLRSAMQKWNNRTFWDWARTHATLSFSSGVAALPGDVRAIYSLKCDTRVGLYMGPRAYDALVEGGAEMTDIWGAPFVYDVAYEPATASSGWKVNLLIPGGDTSGTLRYYRRLTMPTDSSAADLDIPEDYEEGVLARASYHYLLNHGGDSRSERMLAWKAEADEALEDAVRGNQNIPDEFVRVTPVGNSPGIIEWQFR